MSILDYFPFPKIRREQKLALLELEENWEKNGVFVMKGPVGLGKSPIAICIAAWLQEKYDDGAAILTKDNLLLEQLRDDFPQVPAMFAKRYYSVKDFKVAKQRFEESYAYMCNYHTYMAYKNYRECLIVDEAHNLLDPLLSSGIIKIWQHLYGFPDDIYTKIDLLEWIEEATPRTKNHEKKLKKLEKLIVSTRTSHVLSIGWEEYRGAMRRCLKLTPLDARTAPPIWWPPARVKKLVFMSATINEHDIFDMGLDKRRVCYIDCESPIPPANRPFIKRYVAKVNHQNKKTALPHLVEGIKELLKENPTTGIIHAPYEFAALLKTQLGNEPRLMWHTRDSGDKKATYAKFLKSNPKEARVLIASGMYEGLNLKYDLARWQAIVKVPFLSLGDEAIAEKCKIRPTAYAWSAVKLIIQATGRVCRGPNDHGKTYMLDENYERLERTYGGNGGEDKLFPDFFLEAVRA